MVGIDTIAARFSTPASGVHARVHDLTRVTPYSRWDADAQHPSVPHRLGGRFSRFMEGVEGFDAAAFHISPSEACVLDPQQRLMLEVPLPLALSTLLSRSCH